MRFLVLPLLSFIPACQADETLRAYGAADKVWVLSEINDQPFNAKADLTFPDEETIAGSAPCNRYSASMTVPYPWFEVGPIAATKRACPDLQDESFFFEKLREMTLSEVLGKILILSTPEGQKMVFISDG